MSGRHPKPRSKAPARRKRRIFAVTGAVLLAVVAGVVVWSVSGFGSTGQSGGICVNVLVPNGTGSMLLHACGSQARALCHRSLTRQDEAATLTRAECELVGVLPTTAPAGTP